jgi:hypothetical protein
MTEIRVQVIGLEKVREGLAKFPRQIEKYMYSAGRESASAVLTTEGLKKYPPATAANKPPVPYYVRGLGTQTASGNLGQSEDYKHRWTVKKAGYGVEVRNDASYARYLGGSEQVGWAKDHGWRKLTDVAHQKLGKIVAIYNGWIAKLIKDLGL